MVRSYLRKVIGFRLGVREFRALKEVARLKGLRVGQLARQIILEWINQESHLCKRMMFDREGEK